jgi:hypothetical protein
MECEYVSILGKYKHIINGSLKGERIIGKRKKSGTFLYSIGRQNPALIQLEVDGHNQKPRNKKMPD